MIEKIAAAMFKSRGTPRPPAGPRTSLRELERRKARSILHGVDEADLEKRRESKTKKKAAGKMLEKASRQKKVDTRPRDSVG